MTNQKMWKNHHSFYLVTYEVRLLARRNNFLIQQIYNESSDDDSSDSKAGESDDFAYDSSAFNMSTISEQPDDDESLRRRSFDM